MKLDHAKLVRQALDRIKKVAREKSAERLVGKAKKKALPPVSEEVGTEADEEPVDELGQEISDEAAATEGLPDDAPEPPDLEKTTAMVFIGHRPHGGVKTTQKGVETTHAAKRKPGRPRKVP